MPERSDAYFHNENGVNAVMALLVISIYVKSFINGMSVFEYKTQNFFKKIIRISGKINTNWRQKPRELG